MPIGTDINSLLGLNEHSQGEAGWMFAILELLGELESEGGDIVAGATKVDRMINTLRTRLNVSAGHCWIADVFEQRLNTLRESMWKGAIE